MSPAPEPMPEHVKAFLAQIGQWNADGKSRLARLSSCPDCGATVLAGLDGDRAGMPVLADPQEIDETGELLALTLGVRTFRLALSFNASGKRGWNLDPRTKWDIECPQDSAVVAAHRCGFAIPPATRSHLPPWVRRRAKQPTDHPDF